MKLTIAFITGRLEPHLDWMLESLAPQIAQDDEIDVLVIDAHGRTPSQLGVLPSYGHWPSSIRVELPKPTPWQGAHRVTSCDWWAKSSAMNTAYVLCESDYIAFVDDCCQLGPKWLETVRCGERVRWSVIAGTYDKVERGAIVTDGRRKLAPNGMANCGGGWLYGCTFALPLEWALDVNGAEEGCDGMGTEDYIFGFMLENNGHQIDYVTDMAVTLARPETSKPGMPSIALHRTGNGVYPNDRSRAALARFRRHQRTEFSPDLRALRARRAMGDLSWPEVDPDVRDWFDGNLVREIGR